MRKLIWQRYLDILEFSEEDLMITPIGVFPNDFNLWIGHTNFQLTHEEVKKVLGDNGIGMIDGVEGFSVVSPYRFKLCVGEAFNDRQVKKSIQKAFDVINYEGIDPEIMSRIEQLKSGFSHPYWIIYAAPNGNLDHIEGDNLDDIYDKVDIYEKTKSLVGGHIVKSW